MTPTLGWTTGSIDRTVAALAAIPGVDLPIGADNLGRRIEEHRTGVAIVGLVKRGKSTLFNQLIGLDAAAVQALPETAVPMVAVPGPPATTGLNRAGQTVGLGRDSTDRGTVRRLDLVSITVADDLRLPAGVTLIDTPGLGEAELGTGLDDLLVQWRDTAAGAALVILSFPPGVAETDLRVVDEVARFFGNRYAIAMKAVSDDVDPGELEVLAARMGEELGIRIQPLPPTPPAGTWGTDPRWAALESTIERLNRLATTALETDLARLEAAVSRAAELVQSAQDPVLRPHLEAAQALLAGTGAGAEELAAAVTSAIARLRLREAALAEEQRREEEVAAIVASAPREIARIQSLLSTTPVGRIPVTLRRQIAATVERIVRAAPHDPTLVDPARKLLSIDGVQTLLGRTYDRVLPLLPEPRRHRHLLRSWNGRLADHVDEHPEFAGNLLVLRLSYAANAGGDVLDADRDATTTWQKEHTTSHPTLAAELRELEARCVAERRRRERERDIQRLTQLCRDAQSLQVLTTAPRNDVVNAWIDAAARLRTLAERTTWTDGPPAPLAWWLASASPAEVGAAASLHSRVSQAVAQRMAARHTILRWLFAPLGLILGVASFSWLIFFTVPAGWGLWRLWKRLAPTDDPTAYTIDLSHAGSGTRRVRVRGPHLHWWTLAASDTAMSGRPLPPPPLGRPRVTVVAHPRDHRAGRGEPGGSEAAAGITSGTMGRAAAVVVGVLVLLGIVGATGIRTGYVLRDVPAAAPSAAPRTTPSHPQPTPSAEPTVAPSPRPSAPRSPSRPSPSLPASTPPPPANPEAEASQTTPSRPGLGVPAEPGDPAPDLDGAIAVVRSLGFHVRDASTWMPSGFSVLLGEHAEHGSSGADQAFLFADGRYLGKEFFETSHDIWLIAVAPSEITLGYDVFVPDDDDCCASLMQEITFHYDDVTGEVTPDADPASTDPSERFSRRGAGRLKGPPLPPR